MTVKDFRTYMAALADEQSLERITFRGGEPFLFFKTLKRCIEITRRLGRREIAVVTNGYWGGNPTNAQKKLQELKKAGLSSIWFSVDAFHQEFVPFRSVRTAVNAARAIGFDKTIVVSYFLNTVDSRNPFNSRTEEYVKKLYLPENSEHMRYPLIMEGRASDKLTGYLKNMRVISGKCALPFRNAGTLKDPTTIEIDLMGNVMICPGICIGNAKTEPLSRIIKEYDHAKHPIIEPLSENGPRGLYSLHELVENAQSRKYASECHMCYTLRRQLRTRYPEYLTPENCYKE